MTLFRLCSSYLQGLGLYLLEERKKKKRGRDGVRKGVFIDGEMDGLRLRGRGNNEIVVGRYMLKSVCIRGDEASRAILRGSGLGC